MNTSMPGCACSTQTFGDVLVFHPHCHIIITDGTCDEQGNVQITPYDDAHALEHLFRHKVVKMLPDKGAISQGHSDRLLSWHHSGVTVHVCDPIAVDGEAYQAVCRSETLRNGTISTPTSSNIVLTHSYFGWYLLNSKSKVLSRRLTTASVSVSDWKVKPFSMRSHSRGTPHA